METSEKRALEKHLHLKYLIQLLFNVKKGWKMLGLMKKKLKTSKQKRKKQN